LSTTLEEFSTDIVSFRRLATTLGRIIIGVGLHDIDLVVRNNSGGILYDIVVVAIATTLKSIFGKSLSRNYRPVRIKHHLGVIVIFVTL
jgi:hypothetical protein